MFKKLLFGEETKTGYKCMAYFKGIDGLGTCDKDCQWWRDGGCPCAMGSESYDGININWYNE